MAREGTSGGDTYGIHKVELVVNAGKRLGNGSGVGNHTNSPLDLSQIATRNALGLLVVDTTLESGGAPIDELDGALGLDGGNSGVDILGDNVSAVHEAAGHVLSMAGVALGHHVAGLKDRVGDLSNREGLMECLLSGDDRGIRGEHEVDTGVGYQVGLELGDIHVQSTIESKRRSQGTDNLSDQTVQVGVGGSFNVQVAVANIVQGLVVKAEGTVGVLQQGVGGKHGVVGFYNSSRNLRRGRDREGKLGLASVVDGKALQKKRSETRTSTSTSGMEDKESLKTSAVVGKLANAVQHGINNLLSDGVVATGVVVGGILLSVDDLLRVVQLGVGTGADFVTDSGLKIHIDGTGNMLSVAGLAEEGVERIISYADRRIGSHVTIGANAVLKAVQFPALVTGLDTGLTQMDGDAFYKRKIEERMR